VKEVKMALNTLLNKALATAVEDARKRYDAFVAANAKPLTMAERVKGVVRRPVVPFDEYLSAYFAATQGRLHKCSFVAHPRGRQMERSLASPSSIRYPSPDGLCHKEEPTGRHYCHHSAFGRDPYMGTRYGTHYSGTYSMSAVEGHHKEEVARARMAQWRDIDFS
jgi:hypothetical protein